MSNFTVPVGGINNANGVVLRLACTLWGQPVPEDVGLLTARVSALRIVSTAPPPLAQFLPSDDVFHWRISSRIGVPIEVQDECGVVVPDFVCTVAATPPTATLLVDGDDAAGTLSAQLTSGGFLYSRYGGADGDIGQSLLIGGSASLASGGQHLVKLAFTCTRPGVAWACCFSLGPCSPT